MASLRVTSTALSRRALTACKPRLYVGLRGAVSVSSRPISRLPSLTSKYSTEAARPSLAPKVERGGSKLFADADAAVADLKSGSTILSSGFGLCGVAGQSAFVAYIPMKTY